jgi:Ni2+-binding GTPase involved in maturation of urease and hydrogenase
MKVIVSLEIGGVEQKDFHQEINLQTTSEYLSLEDLISHLQISGIRHPISPASIISYYNEDRHAYRTLKKGDHFHIQETIKILVRHQNPEKVLESIKSSLSQLSTRLDSLILKVESSKPVQKRPSKPSVLRQFSELDIGVLGATPLVSKSGPVENCALDFEVERRKLVEKLMVDDNDNSHHAKGANIRFEVATLDNLTEILEAKPKILYLICQGYYRKEPTAEFVLAFEQSFDGGVGNRIGCLEEVTAAQLKMVLDSSPQYFQIVIVKGAFSQEMAKVLRKAGFPCVLAAHQLPDKPLMQDNQSSDDFVTDFCVTLLGGKSVKEAFKTLSERFQDKESCCCAHEHLEECKWVKELDLSLIYESHKNHTISCNCAGHFQAHKLDCSSAINYFLNEHQDSYLDSKSGKYLLVCCCQNNLKSEGLQHQGFNFTIHCADDNYLDTILFEENKKSQLNIISELPVSWKPPYLISVTDARRKEIHQLLRLVSHHRCVNLYGEAGMGKTILLKRAGFYAYERRLFTDGVVYFDFTKKDIVFLYRTISKTLNLPVFDHYTDLFSVLNNKDVLLIMDNIDELVCEDSKNAFFETYENFLKFTEKPKFIICCVNKLDLKTSEFFELPGLNDEQKCRFIKRRLDTYKPNERFPSTSSNPTELLKYIESRNRKLGSSPRHSAVSPEMAVINTMRTRALGSSYFFNIMKFLQFGAYRFSIEEIWQSIQQKYPDARMSLTDMLTALLRHPETRNLLTVEAGEEFFKLKSEVWNQLQAQLLNEDQSHFYFKIAIKSLASISTSILQAALKEEFRIGYEFRRSLAFFNGGLNHGIWKRFAGNGALKDKVYDPGMFFEKIEYNFWHYIKENDLRKIFNDLLKVNDEVKAALSEIIISTVSIFTLFGNFRDAAEYIERSRSCCKTFSLDLTYQIISLMQCSICLNEGKFFEVQIGLESISQYFKDTNDFEGLGECLLLKALGCENFDEKIKNLQLASAQFKDANCLPGYARSALAIIEIKHSLKELGAEQVSLCAEISDIFEKAGLKSWKTRSDLYLSSCYFSSEKLNVAREILENALKYVKTCKDSNIERVIIEKLQEINEHIIKNNKNSICLLKAFPLVEKIENDVISNAGCIWRFSSVFRVNLMNNLDAVNKKLYIRMDTASLDKLQMCLNEKPAILHLASEMQAENCFYLEKENGLADLLTFKEFKSIFQVSLSYHNLKLLVLALPFSKSFAENCYRELGITHVVYFSFPHYPQHFSKVLLSLSFEKSIHFFCIQFYTYLVQEETVAVAFRKAKKEMIGFMGGELEKYPHLDLEKDLNVMEWWSLHFEDDPVLLDAENPAHDQKVFFFSPDSEGRKIELSSIRGPCNVKNDGPPQKTYVGRQGEMFNIIEVLAQTRCINLFGAEGMGKTELVKQIAYFLYVRNRFPDGIYLIDLKDHHTLEDVYRDFKNQGFSGFSTDIDPKSFLLDKKILFILENCEVMIQKAPHTFNSLLQKFVNECRISVIITSVNHLQKNEISGMKRIALRTLTRFEIYAYLCLVMPAFVSRQLVDESDKDHFDAVIKKLTKKFQGVPGNVAKYKSLLEHNKLSRIVEILEDDYEGLSALPDLAFKRASSTTTYETTMKIPVLSSGRSSCEHYFKMNTTEQ